MERIYKFLGLSDSEGSDDEESRPRAPRVKKQRKETEEDGQEGEKPTKKASKARKRDEAAPDAVELGSVAPKSVKVAARKIALNTSLEQLAPPRMVFVGNLSFDIDETKLQEYFEAEVGDVSNIVVARNNSGRPSGYGYVEFGTEEGVVKALGINGHALNGRPCTVSRFKASRRVESRMARAEKPKQMKKNRVEHRKRVKEMQDRAPQRQQRKRRREDPDDK